MSITEALLLGSVMPLAMLVHDFSLLPLVLLPIWSICINALAHSNCNKFDGASEHSLLSLVRHHQSHHSRYSGNFSFLFIQLDRWFGTARSF
jgi:Delta7-sterol 5-desaturase